MNDYYFDITSLDKEELNVLLKIAINHKQFEQAIYLLSSPKLKQNADINCNNGSLLMNSCKEGDIEIISFLLNNKEIPENMNINIDNDKAIITACCYANVETVKYLLESPDLKNHSQISSNNIVECIRYAYANAKIDIIDYLIFDYKIDNPFLNQSNNELEIIELPEEYKKYFENKFSKREINENLKQNLIEKKETSKIKI